MDTDDDFEVVAKPIALDGFWSTKSRRTADAWVGAGACCPGIGTAVSKANVEEEKQDLVGDDDAKAIAVPRGNGLRRLWDCTV